MRVERACKVDVGGVQAEAAKELVADMQRQGLNPDIYTYAPLVGALGGAGRVEEAMQVRLFLSDT
jgi:hypothetical protein